MHRLWNLGAGVLVVAAMGLLAEEAHAAILANGDFETPYVQYALPPGWADSAAVVGGPQNAPNLFVVKGSDYLACCGTSGTPPALANQFATFGAGNSPNAGGVLAQSFATVLGQSYLVRFDLAAFGIPGTQAMRVNIDDVTNATNTATHDYLVASNSDLDAGFNSYAFAFTATGALTRLSFQDLDSVTDNIDAVVDNISVAGAPEPVSWLLMIVGFGGLGAGLRRHRRVELAACARGAPAAP
jgi:hypothetical protein